MGHSAARPCHGNGASDGPRRTRREPRLPRAEARDANRPDDEIIEDVLSRYLLERLLDKTQGPADETEEEATRRAVEELHAMRRERDAAA
jgi:hypothetical protein